MGEHFPRTPPWPAMPPPQAPFPPGLATPAAWTGSDQGGANGGTDPYAGYSNYAQQQYAGYRVGEMQAGNSYGNPNYPVAANGAQGSYAQGYAGYNYMGHQNADNYQRYQGYQNSYGQNAAMYSNTAAPYAPPAQYAHPGPHTDAGSYWNSGNCYDPYGYRSGGYRHPGDGEQAQSSWTDPNQEKYNRGGYVNAGYGAKPEENMQTYAVQDYSQQWAEYYASLEAAPQAANAGAPQVVAPTYANVVAAPSSQQPPPPGTAASVTSWAAGPALQQAYGESQGAQVPSSTEAQTAGAAWNGGASQSDRFSLGYFPPLPTQTRPASAQHQNQRLEFQRIQVGHSIQQKQQLVSKVRAKLSNVKNPRISGNVGGVGAGKQTAKPAKYVSVAAKKAASSSAATDAVVDATLQPGMFPSSLQAYVERALSRCKEESQKVASQDIMKAMITSASMDGSLFTRDWDTEPLFAIPPASSLASATKKETPQQQSKIV